MTTGSCQCGGIKFEIEKVTALTHCHCSVCRKTTGASFATFAHVRSSDSDYEAARSLSVPGTSGCRVTRAAFATAAVLQRRNLSRRPEW